LVPVDDGVSLLALSGIKSREDVLPYESLSVIKGILVGEHLMRAENPSAEMHALVSDSAKHSNKVLVKICGISRAEDALAACRAKADLIGIVFAEKSPRQVQPEDAKVIVQAVRNFRETKSAISLDSSTLAGNHDGNSDHKRARLTDWFQNGAKRLQKACSRGPLVVGVFMNQSIDFINDTVKTAELDLVQLHGNESWKTCSACLAPVIKVIHVPVVQQLSDEDILNSVEEGQGPLTLKNVILGRNTLSTLPLETQAGQEGALLRICTWVPNTDEGLEPPTYPDVETAFAALSGKRFDLCILVSDAESIPEPYSERVVCRYFF